MPNTHSNPSGVHAPGGPYSHSVEVAAGARLLFVAGQTGTTPDGAIPEGIGAQAEAAWSNLVAVLEGSGFSMADVVQMKTFLTRREDRDGYNRVRGKYLGEHRPASTFLIVSGLADPKMLVEIEAVAAKG